MYKRSESLYKTYINCSLQVINDVCYKILQYLGQCKTNPDVAQHTGTVQFHELL